MHGMSVTTLDPKTALIVIDLQKGLAAFPAVDPVQAIARKAGALASAFRRHGQPVVLTGVATSIGVESTACEAYARGFNVTLAVDAMTDLSADAHANRVTRIFPRSGETGTTEEIVALLDNRRI
jgi:nicotinamidase-related amidase